MGNKNIYEYQRDQLETAIQNSLARTEAYLRSETEAERIQEEIMKRIGGIKDGRMDTSNRKTTRR